MMQHPYSSRGSVGRTYRRLPPRPLPKRRSVLPLFDLDKPESKTFVIDLNSDGKQIQPTPILSWRGYDSSESDDEASSHSDSSSFWSPEHDVRSMASVRSRHTATSYSSTSTITSELDFACAGHSLSDSSESESDRSECSTLDDADAQYIYIPPENPLHKPISLSSSSPKRVEDTNCGQSPSTPQEYTPTGDIVFDIFAKDLHRTAYPSPPPSYLPEPEPCFELTEPSTFDFDHECFQGLEAKLLLSPMDVFEDVCWAEFELDNGLIPSVFPYSRSNLTSWIGLDDDDEDEAEDDGHSWMEWDGSRDKPLPDVPSNEGDEELVDLYEYWGQKGPTLVARFSLAKPPRGRFRERF